MMTTKQKTDAVANDEETGNAVANDKETGSTEASPTTNTISKSNCLESAPWLCDKEEENLIVPASYPGMAQVTFEDLERKTVLGIVLSVKHCTQTKFQIMERSTYNSFGQSLAAKRQRQSSQHTYDRILICGDLISKGSCFAVICNNHGESRNVFAYMKNGIAVGCIFALGEPKKDDATLGMHMPILSTGWPLVPVHIPPTKTMIKYCKTVKLSIPLEAGEHRYFCLHQESISVSNFRFKFDVICNVGRFCDRVDIAIAKNGQQCGCLQSGYTTSSIVAQFNVTLKTTRDKISEPYSIANFRSLRTTEYFVTNLDEFGMQNASVLDEQVLNIREKIKAMVEMINSNGGWTMVGWFRKGEVKDVSSTDQKIDNDTVTPHISCLVPTRKDYAHLTNTSFNAIRLRVFT